MPGLRADGTRPTQSERRRARTIFARLVARYPTIGTALDYRSPWELLVVTVLSAQTTDETVNRVAPQLFERYPAPADLAEANPEDVEKIVFSTGFYRQKTKSIIGLAAAVEEQFGGVVPDNLADLTTLPGVGRKTASVLLAEAWDQPAIAVDTHVRRVAGRLGLTAETNPTKIEHDLMALYPRDVWSGISMRFIQFGRDTCIARQPKCGSCELYRLCPWPHKTAR